MDTDIRVAEGAGGAAIAATLALGHLDINIILGTAIGVVIVTLIRPTMARMLAKQTAEPDKKP